MSEQIDISKIEDRATVVDTIISDIDAWCEKQYDDGHRRHLGASIIGKPCARELWYSFRWAKKEKLGENSTRSAGQILRLFQRGHREERSIIEYLQGVGCRFEASPDEQIRIEDLSGHFGGSLDNEGYLPPRYGIKEKILFEFKTSNMAEFNQLKKKGMKDHKPIHWSQMCVYGFKRDLYYGLYLCVDKNTDEIYMELVKLDHEHGKSMIDKAGMVITSKEAPPKFSMTATNFACKWCNFAQICHHGEAVEKNCRSCVNAAPGENKTWLCGLAPDGQNTIPENVIAIGCPQYKGIQ